MRPRERRGGRGRRRDLQLMIYTDLYSFVAKPKKTYKTTSIQIDNTTTRNFQNSIKTYGTLQKTHTNRLQEGHKQLQTYGKRIVASVSTGEAFVQALKSAGNPLVDI